MGITRLSDTYLSSLPIGAEIPWPDASSVPAGFLKLDGTAYSRTVYADLFDHYGTAHGSGDGSTTFNIPDYPVDTLPWNLPRGRVAYAANTTGSASFAGGDLTGVSVTFTAEANRRYRVSGFVRLYGASVAGDKFVHIRNGSDTEQQIAAGTMTTSSQVTYTPSVVVTPGAGSVTYKLWVNTSSGTVGFVGGSAYPAFILVEDIGADTSQSPWSLGCWLVKGHDAQPTLVGAPYEVATSSTQPDGSAGKMLYETDEHALKVYDGTDYRPPWNMPWGIMGYAETTSATTDITTMQDIAGLSVTFTAVANRRYKITAEGLLQAATNGQGGFLVIRDGSGNQLQVRHLTTVNNAVSEGITATIVESPPAGSVTYKVSVEYSVGGNVDFVGTANAPAFILVEDIGPNGDPA